MEVGYVCGEYSLQAFTCERGDCYRRLLQRLFPLTRGNGDFFDANRLFLCDCRAYTDSGGDLHFVKDGDQEVRKIQKMMGGLRVLQGDRTWLEFERIE